MKPTRAMLMLAALALCAPLFAQAAPAEGELIPRAGTLMYMVSDRPEVLYRMFGTDKNGNWRLRALAGESLDKELAGAKPGEARAARDVVDYIFNAYESLAQVEVGLIDVTMDGPKYLLHLKLKPGKTIDIKPKFLGEYLNRTVEHRGVKYLLYRPEGEVIVEDVKEGPEPEEGGAPAGPARKKGAFGMDRYYVASVGESLLLSNFESTIRDAIDLYADAERQESLAARPEFKQWRESRGRHDLSVFIIGREVQNLIERLLPSKEQVGADADLIYKRIDAWLQFREYRYVVFDFDYDEKARAATMAATLKTARPTRFLEKFSIEPAKFTAMKYVPEGAAMTAGFQLGDAKKTFDNLVEFARDMQSVIAELEKLGIGAARPGVPDFPPPERAEPGEGPVPPAPPAPPAPPEENKAAPDEAGNPWLPRKAGLMRGLLGMAQEAQPGEEAPAAPDKVEEMLRQLDKALEEFGTTREEVLSVLGNQVVIWAGVDPATARRDYRGSTNDLMKAMHVGLVIALKDAAKAKEILAKAREKDPEGAFKGMASQEHAGIELHTSPERNYGYAITGDALLVAITPGSLEGAAEGILRQLKAMIDGSSRPARTGFVAEGSKVLEVDVGLVMRLELEAMQAHQRRLDRYARPLLGKSVNEYMTELTMALRTREHKDGIELAMRVGGLPDFGALLETGMGQMFGGGANPDRDSYSYTEENLRQVANALRVEAAKDVPAFDVGELVKSGKLRAGALQTPFDSRWKGGRDKLGWVTLEQIKRDEDGELPGWVSKEVAEIIEANEKEGFRSFKLAEGNLAEHVTNYASGMIVLYQEKAETLGGHMILYADGQVGWLHADVLKQALELNKEGKPVPAADQWRAGEKPDEGASPPPKGEDNPWLPPKD